MLLCFWCLMVKCIPTSWCANGIDHAARGCNHLQVYSTPLVGVWVKGPSNVLHPLVAAACLRFAYSSLLMDRAVNPEDGAFLLLLCPEGEHPAMVMPVSTCHGDARRVEVVA